MSAVSTLLQKRLITSPWVTKHNSSKREGLEQDRSEMDTGTVTPTSKIKQASREASLSSKMMSSLKGPHMMPQYMSIPLKPSSTTSNKNNLRLSTSDKKYEK